MKSPPALRNKKGKEAGNGFFPGPWRWLKVKLLRVMRLRGDPFSLARGVGIGVFVGLTPTIPLHTVLIGVLCLVFRGSFPAGIASSLVVSNPLTIPFCYAAAWMAGALVTGDTSPGREIDAFIEGLIHSTIKDVPLIIGGQGVHLLLTLLAGGFVIAVPVSVAAYFASLRIYIAIHRRRVERHNRRGASGYDRA